MSASALRPHRLARITTIALTGLAVFAAAPSASAQEGFPGTIKVSGVTDEPDPDNQAKPGCTARVDYFNFKTGTYDVGFTAVPPSGTQEVLSTTVDITQEAKGGNDVQQSERYRLDVSGLEMDGPGYKLQVRVSDPDKSGGGGKSKVFSFECLPESFGGGTGAAGGGVNPAGGFQTGFGGADGALPLLPMTALAAGLTLVGVGVTARRRSRTR
jgi:hypothetical protein